MRSINHDRGLILGRGRRQGEEGFALIAALLVFWVLTALGMLVFSVTTQDVRVSSRTVGERKAFSAAESGLHRLTQGFDPALPDSSSVTNVVVDSTSSGDPNTKYTIAAPPSGWNPTSGPGGVPIPGYEPNWGRKRFLAQVTGTNTAYNSTMQINVGVGYGPVDITTLYK
jgi:Tfp pilus assembly protein PilX